MHSYKKIFRLNFKKEEIALISLIILMMFAGFHFAWKKTSANTALIDLKAKTVASTAKLAAAQAVYEKLTKLTPSSEGFSADYMDQYLRTNDHFSGVISGMVNGSKGNAFSLSKISLESQSVENGYKQMVYSVDVEASFIAIGKFLERLEDAPLLTEVNAVEINRIDNEMKRCLAHITLYSYVRAE